MPRHIVTRPEHEGATIPGILAQAVGHEPDAFNPELLGHYGHVVRTEHDLAEEHAGKAVRHAVTCGVVLAFVKGHLNHGQFAPWLEEYFPGSLPTAQRWMRLATLPDTILRLPSFSPARGYALLTLPEGELKELEDQINANPEFRDQFDAMTATELRIWARKRDNYDETWRKRHDKVVAEGQRQVEKLQDEMDALRRQAFLTGPEEQMLRDVKRQVGKIALDALWFRKIPDIVSQSFKNELMAALLDADSRLQEIIAETDDRVLVERLPNEQKRWEAEHPDEMKRFREEQEKKD